MCIGEGSSREVLSRLSVLLDWPPLEVRTSKVRVPEMGLVEQGSLQLGPAEVGPVQLRLAEVGPVQLRLVEVGPLQLGPHQVGPLQLRLVEVGPLQLGPLQVGPLQLSSGEEGLLQLGHLEDAGLPAQVGPGQISSEGIPKTHVLGCQPFLVILQDASQLLIRKLPIFGFGGGSFDGSSAASFILTPCARSVV
jgi:hypothetical protein